MCRTHMNEDSPNGPRRTGTNGKLSSVTSEILDHTEYSNAESMRFVKQQYPTVPVPPVAITRTSP